MAAAAVGIGTERKESGSIGETLSCTLSTVQGLPNGHREGLFGPPGVFWFGRLAASHYNGSAGAETIFSAQESPEGGYEARAMGY